MARNPNVNKGWFVLATRDGDRTLEQQMEGLDKLVAEVPGKSVLDVGCAEGLISIRLCEAGATQVHGVEIVKRHVEFAEQFAVGLPCTFECINASDFVPPQAYDIVIMFALLHKLKDPGASCRVLAAAARDLCVIRVPPGFGHSIVDQRSDRVEYDLDAIMSELGFVFESEVAGPFEEPTLFYRRVV